MKKGIEHISGKTISAVVTAKNPRAPRQQVTLVFTDGTRLELFGEGIECAPVLHRGGILEAVRSARHGGGDVKVFAQECAPRRPLSDSVGRSTH
jgi:hypothetical protein